MVEVAKNILVVDDEVDIRNLLKEILDDEGYDVVIAANAKEARHHYGRRKPDLVLLDVWMPDTDGVTLLREWVAAGDVAPVVLMSGHGTVETAVQATRLGAHDYLEKPVSLSKLLDTVRRVLATESVLESPVFVVNEPIGQSSRMTEAQSQLAELAGQSSHVLLRGERGVEKEQLAVLFHSQVEAGARPFITLHAEDVPENASSTYLVGNPETGTVGVFEQANDGVLFVTELGDLPEDAQRLLVGAVNSGMYYNGIDATPQKLACVLVIGMTDTVASHQSGLLQKATIIDIPPLRERPDDVVDLLRRYAEWLADEDKLSLRSFTTEAQNRLRHYAWPGNVAELKALVAAMARKETHAPVEVSEVDHWIDERDRSAHTAISEGWLELPMKEAREKFEKAYLLEQLERYEGKVGLVAKNIGVERTHLYRKLRSLGINLSAGNKN